MSLVLRFNLLRNNIWSSCPVRFLKQHAGFSYEKLLQPGSYEKRHFTTKLTETASLHKTHSASCIPAISPLWLQQTSERDQPATILVFDIETTGFLHADHRIIEFALRDLSGEKIAHLRLSLILNGMFPNMLQKPTRLPLNWYAGLMFQGSAMYFQYY